MSPPETKKDRDMPVGNDSPAPEAAVNNASSQSAPAIEVTSPAEKQTEDSHLELSAVFTCLDGVSKSDSESIDRHILQEHLEEVEEFLRRETSFSDRKAYKDCPKSPRSSILKLLDERAEQLGKSESKERTNLGAQSHFEDQIDIFNAVDIVFKFFFPLTFDGSTVEKFWGAMKHIFTVRDNRYLEKTTALNPISQSESPQSSRQHQSITEFRSQLRRLAVSLAPFNELFSNARGSDRVRITVPDEFTDAWIHLILGLVHLRTDMARSEMFIDGAMNLLAKGMKFVQKSLSRQPIVESSALLPLEIFSMMSIRLIQRISNVGNRRPGTDESKSDIAQVYRKYLNEIASSHCDSFALC
jgi:hypothetical protein